MTTSQGADRFVHRPMDSVFIALKNIVYIGVKDREQFDLLGMPCHDHGENERGHVLTKTVEQDGVMVIFQHWLKSLTAEAYLELREKERAAEAARADSEEAA